jgi:hypothetical protein
MPEVASRYRRQPRLEHQLVAEHVHRVGRSKATTLSALRCRLHTSGVALNGRQRSETCRHPPRPTKGDGSKTEFATPATACQECETRCQKARLAACRLTHKATRTANRRPARQRHRHGSAWQARAGVLSRPPRQAAPCAPAVVRGHNARSTSRQSAANDIVPPGRIVAASWVGVAALPSGRRDGGYGICSICREIVASLTRCSCRQCRRAIRRPGRGA